MRKIFIRVSPENFSKNDFSVQYEVNFKIDLKQYSVKEYKEKNFYKYQKEFQSIVKKNPRCFEFEKLDISSTLYSFFLRTYNLGHYESLGNLLVIVDILKEISKEIKDNEITIYLSNNLEDVVKSIFKNKKITFVYQKTSKNFFDFKTKFFFNLRIFTKGLFSKIKFNDRKRLFDSKIVFLKPFSFKSDIHKFPKEYLGEKGKKFVELTHDLKNNLMKKDEYIKILDKKILYVGQLLSSKDILRINSLFRKNKSLLKKEKIIFKYDDINLTKPLAPFYDFYKKKYLKLISESYVMADKFLETYDEVFYSNTDDHFIELLSILNLKYNKKLISLQYEPIYEGCYYNFYNNKNITECVWNEYTKNILIKKYQYPEDNVINIGNIRFDKIKKVKQSKINVVLTTQGEMYPVLVDFFIDSVSKVRKSNLNFYIKPHPLEDSSIIESKIKDSGLKIKLIENESISKTLSYTSVLISYSSVTILEAINNGILPVVINPYKLKPAGVAYYDHVPYFKTTDELSVFFNNLTEGLNKIKVSSDLVVEDFNKKKFEVAL